MCVCVICWTISLSQKKVQQCSIDKVEAIKRISISKRRCFINCVIRHANLPAYTGIYKYSILEMIDKAALQSKLHLFFEKTTSFFWKDYIFFEKTTSFFGKDYILFAKTASFFKNGIERPPKASFRITSILTLANKLFFYY